MDSYSYSFSSSSSNNSSSSTQFPPYNYVKEKKKTKENPSFRSSLHSVRGAKIMKKHTAPMPPTPPKVYKVDPVNFKDVVQKLTSAAQSTRLKELAPPALSLDPMRRLHVDNNSYYPSCGMALPAKFVAESNDEKPQKMVDIFGALSPLGFNMSPGSIEFCTSLLMTPGSLASLEPSAAQLTGLKEVAPPAISLSPLPRSAVDIDQYYPSSGMSLSAKFEGFVAESNGETPQKMVDNFGALSPLGFIINISPASMAFCSSFLMSPGSLASMQPSAVL